MSRLIFFLVSLVQLDIFLFSIRTGMDSLRIFLSHKLGGSKGKATKVASALSLLANDRMSVVYSANFDRGDNWEPRIRAELANAHWFILLYDGPDANHDWCLWEAGYFRAQMEQSDGTRRLICLHDPRHTLPGPLRGFTAVPARDDEVYHLFRQIYLDDPWKLGARYFAQDGQEEIRNQVKKVVRAVGHEEEIEAQFVLSPTFTFHLKRSADHGDADQNPDDKLIRALRDVGIPADTHVSGEGQWETLFGKPDATVAWTWRNLIKGVQEWEPWAHQLAGMMANALHYQNVSHPSLALRVKLSAETASEEIYRVILRRLEKTKEECRFTFAAARIIATFRPENHVRETRIFHLYNMAWFFRRHFLEKHLSALRELELAESPKKEKLDSAVRAIDDDLKAMLAEAQVRGVEDPARIIKAFNEPLRGEVRRALQVQWRTLDGEFRSACAKTPRDLTAIIRTIEAMEPINRFFLNTSLQELQRITNEDRGLF